MKVQVIENVLKLNDEMAAMNRETLRAAGVFTIDLMGAPGCGKTSLLEATLPRLQTGNRLPRPLRAGVVAGDLATQRDADRMAKFCDQVVQVNTGKGCHLEAHHVRQALAQLDLSQLDILFIENVGNLICPVGFDLGQDAKVGMFAVSDGDDKAAKHPFIVCEADLLILGKIDLLPHVPFNRDLFLGDIQKLHPTTQVMELSALRGLGMENWLAWLASRAGSHK